MNEAYSQLALNYDSFMEEVPYEKWFEFIETVWGKFDIKKPENILDLCCGTGTITIMLKEKGYDVCGIDNSFEMLAKASKKTADLNLSIPFYEMDMMEFQLPNKVDAVICCCDGINYAVDDDEILDTFNSVNRNLADNGVFIFDLNTEYKFKEVLGNKQYSAIEEDFAYFWQNEYDETEHINTYYVTLFKKDENNDIYERFEECHWERAYNIVETQKLLDETGFELLGLFNNYELLEVDDICERYVFVAQKKVNIK